MAGGPSTAALTAAVAEAGGYGFVAAGYLSAEELRQATISGPGPAGTSSPPEPAATIVRRIAADAR